MTFNLTLWRYGIEHSLTDGTYCRWLGEEGMGMPPVSRKTYQNSQQDGEIDVGYRINPRIIRLALEIEGTSLSDLYNKRDQLVRFFGPSNTPLHLRFYRDDQVRDIACFCADGLKYATADMEGFSLKTVVTLTCPSPYFTDPTPVYMAFTIGSGSSGTVPRAIPRIVGTLSANLTRNVLYHGNAPSNPYLLIIHGPITNPIIRIYPSNEKLDFTGTTLTAGQALSIDTRWGHKSVVDANGANQISLLSKDSNLATFHLTPSPYGYSTYENSFTFTGSAVTAATMLEIEYEELYI